MYVKTIPQSYTYLYELMKGGSIYILKQKGLYPCNYESSCD